VFLNMDNTPVVYYGIFKTLCALSALAVQFCYPARRAIKTPLCVLRALAVQNQANLPAGQ
jgi:hypothetical protein